MIKVVLVDDHNLIRQGLRALLEKAGDIAVVGEAADGQEAVALVERLTPDVAVMDIAMSRLNGIQATERICALDGGTKVVILSMYSEPTLVRQALRNGAKGYLLKSSVTEELLLAIRTASRGETYLGSAVSGVVVAEYLSRESAEPTIFERLSPRERETLQLIAEGNTNKAIALHMNISVKTVEKHRANLMSKLYVRDMAGLVRIAIRYGLIPLNE